MAPKHKLPENIPLHNQGLNYKANVCELEDHVGERDGAQIGQQSLGLQKKLVLQIFLVTY
jgi:hypothetical protein